MNWGKAIILGMAAFMMFILVLGIRMMTQPTDDYDHDYYEKGLTFDTDYRKEKQMMIDDAQPVAQLRDSNLTVKFKEMAVGKIHFLRPADRSLDRTLKFNSDINGNWKTSLTLPATGEWRLVFEWESNKKQYLYEQEIFVP